MLRQPLNAFDFKIFPEPTARSEAPGVSLGRRLPISLSVSEVQSRCSWANENLTGNLLKTILTAIETRSKNKYACMKSKVLLCKINKQNNDGWTLDNELTVYTVSIRMKS